MTKGNRLGLGMVAAFLIIGTASSVLNAAERVVLGEYFTSVF